MHYVLSTAKGPIRLVYTVACFQIDERDYKIHVAKTQKDQLQMDYHAKLMLTEQNYNRHIVSEELFIVYYPSVP